VPRPLDKTPDYIIILYTVYNITRKEHMSATGSLAPEACCQDDTKIVYKTETDIPYRTGPGATPYMLERCKVDVYHPANRTGFATVVWFHGGGIYEGEKYFPEMLNSGVAIVAVNYRLSPGVKCVEAIDDAAAAVAWTFNNISQYGGSPDKIFVSGHSAGGYLTSMVGLDKTLLAKHGVDANKIVGLIPLSGHAITHFTIREERGIPSTTAIIDELAPIYHARGDAPPILLVTGDREKELFGRYEENAYLLRMLKLNGHQDCTLFELQGYGHGMDRPAMVPALEFINRICPPV